MGQADLHPPAAALGGAEPWGAAGVGEAGPGRVIRPGDGQPWGGGRQLGYWAVMAVEAVRCAKLEGHSSRVVRLTHPVAPGVSSILTSYLSPSNWQPLHHPWFPKSSRIRTASREVYRIRPLTILPRAPRPQLSSLPFPPTAALALQVSEQVFPDSHRCVRSRLRLCALSNPYP